MHWYPDAGRVLRHRSNDAPQGPLRVSVVNIRDILDDSGQLRLGHGHAHILQGILLVPRVRQLFRAKKLPKVLGRAALLAR